eukprot:920269-Pyramimonas_sp.AAC.1
MPKETEDRPKTAREAMIAQEAFQEGPQKPTYSMPSCVSRRSAPTAFSASASKAAPRWLKRSPKRAQTAQEAKLSAPREDEAPG